MFDSCRGHWPQGRFQSGLAVRHFPGWSRLRGLRLPDVYQEPSHFTREGSLVRSQPRPLPRGRLSRGLAASPVLSAGDDDGSVATPWQPRVCSCQVQAALYCSAHRSTRTEAPFLSLAESQLALATPLRGRRARPPVIGSAAWPRLTISPPWPNAARERSADTHLPLNPPSEGNDRLGERPYA